MAEKQNWAKIIRMIDKRKEALRKERDKLDEFISELETLSQDCEEAHEALQEARDALSRMV